MKKKNGFTLVEILTILIIISILLVISIPKVIDVIEKAERKVYKESVESMAHIARLQYQTGESTGGISIIPVEGITYTFENGEYTSSNQLKFEGDNPFSGSITLTKDKKIIINKLVSKNKKWCAVKDANETHVRVGKSKDPDFACIVEENEPIEDIKICDMETETEKINGEEKDVYYIDSPSDLYALSQSVNSGNTYEGKIIKVRNNLDMSKAEGECVTDFEPIGTQENKFKGTFDGNAKTISNLTINKPELNFVGLFGYIEDATITKLFTNNINVIGNKYVGTIGYAMESNITTISLINTKVQAITQSDNYSYVGGLIGSSIYSNINEIFVKNMNVEGNRKYIGLIFGTESSPTTQVSNALIKSGSVKDISDSLYSVYTDIGMTGGSGQLKNSIVENLSVTSLGPSIKLPLASYQSYYSNNVTINDENVTDGFNSESIGDISFYEAAGLDTWIGGDSDSTGYYFDITSSGEVELVSVKDKPIPETPKLSGSGTKNDPYIINNANDWKQMSSRPNIDAYYKINNDIDFSNEYFYMLGSRNHIFNGHIDGNGKTISNVAIIPNKEGYLGLISNMSSGSVNNLYLNNIKIYGGSNDEDNDQYVGIFAYVSDSTIKELFTNNTEIKGSHSIGTIGLSTQTDISVVILENSYIKSNTIYSTQAGEYSYAGGLIGHSWLYNTVNEVLADNVNVEANGQFVGLIFGVGDSTSTTNALNILVKSGNVINTDSNNYTGMLDGNWGVNNSIIENLTVTAPIVKTMGTNWTLYYSNNVIVNGNNVTDGFDPIYVGDLDYYTDKVETLYNGDVNNTGYFFDYVDEKGGIYLVKAYIPTETDTPSEKTGCTIEYGEKTPGCYSYNSGVHGNYLYEAASSEDTGTGGACTGTGRLPAFRTRIYYNCD